MDERLDAGAVAALLGVPKGWVFEQSRRGTIPTVTLGRYRRYRRTAVEEWIRGLEADSQAPPGLRRSITQ